MSQNLFLFFFVDFCFQKTGMLQQNIPYKKQNRKLVKLVKLGKRKKTLVRRSPVLATTGNYSMLE
jgi:hypothetical protein